MDKNKAKEIFEKLEWKCQNSNHPSFHKSYDHVITRNQWCPDCYKYKKKKI